MTRRILALGRDDPPLPVLLRCDLSFLRKVRYVFDTLFLAAGVPVRYVDTAPDAGPWIDYGACPQGGAQSSTSLFMVHEPAAWKFFSGDVLRDRAETVDGLPLVFPPRPDPGRPQGGINFDLAANAFYFLCSWAERRGRGETHGRQLHATSEFVRLGVPQDIVDRYLSSLIGRLRSLESGDGTSVWPSAGWPGRRSFAVALSHDVDFLPVRPLDNVVQGVKTVMRHLVRHCDPADAWRAAHGWLGAALARRDPYGCVPEIIARERAMGLRSSFQVAVGHRHANDVNYRIEDDRVRDYLCAITDAGFDLCLHGSYRSAENVQWYVEEAELLGRRLTHPLGSRQHFLSFDYDQLFTAQEAAGIRYDMSMGYPDRPGPRAGFSYPYFPYNLREDRPYQVLQISLFLMDVTLRGYMRLRPSPARAAIDTLLSDLRDKGGCASVVWHPIVFGGARDPGYDALYYEMAARVGEWGGLATDGRTIHDFWRSRGRGYASFR